MNSEQSEFECPRCGQGGLQPVNLTPFPGRSFWICEECDALWEQAESPQVRNANGYQDYGTFMEAHGYTGNWNYATGATSYVFNGVTVEPKPDDPNA